MRKVLTLILIIMCMPAAGQKALRNIRTQLKDNKPAEAIKTIDKLKKDTSWTKDIRLYELGIEAYILQNELLNEKIYLKQRIDTTEFFKSTLGVIQFTLLADSMLIASDAIKEKKKDKIRKVYSANLHKYYRNLTAGGKYWFAKRNYIEADKYLSLSLEIPKKELWGKDSTIVSSEEYHRTAFLALQTNYLLERYQPMLDYASVLFNDTLFIDNTLSSIALMAEKNKDTVSYEKYLRLGINKCAENPFYFTRLINLYIEQEKYSKAMLLVDSLLRVSPDNLQYSEGKSLVSLKMENYDEAIFYAKKCINSNANTVEPYYYIGLAYCNLATAVSFPRKANSSAYRLATDRQRDYFRDALPYMEKYRELAPEHKELWAPLLYKIYLALNMGSKFEEIDKILK